MQNRLILILTCIAVIFFKGVFSQDTLAPIRDFIRYSNEYRQPFMHLNMTMSNNSNIVLTKEDTISVDSDFFVTPTESYMNFGNMEQLVNDTQALLVSKDDNRMILYTNAAVIIEQLRKRNHFTPNNSSLKSMAANYKGLYANSADRVETIELINRTNIPGTSLPKEQFSMKYNSKKKILLEITIIKRTLLPAKELLHSEKTENNKGDSVRIGDEWFLVKVNFTIYRYNKIQYDNVKVPIRIADRIIRNASGEYGPVANYEHFAINIQ